MGAKTKKNRLDTRLLIAVVSLTLLTLLALVGWYYKDKPHRFKANAQPTDMKNFEGLIDGYEYYKEYIKDPNKL